MTAFGILKFNLETYLVLVEHSAFIGMTHPDVFLSGLVYVRIVPIVLKTTYTPKRLIKYEWLVKLILGLPPPEPSGSSDK